MPAAKTQLKSKPPLPFPSFLACVSQVLYSCDSMGHSQPGSSVHGIFQARILEWVCSLFFHLCSISLPFHFFFKLIVVEVSFS